MKTNHSNCVILVCNLGFLDHALFIAQQLQRQHNDNFDIIIGSADDFPDGFCELKNISFLKIQADDFTNDLPITARLGKYAYWRIPAIEMLSYHYKKILYLDTDIFINSKNIGDIFNINLENYAIAAIRDVHQVIKPNRIPNECRILDKPWIPYFNSGVLMVNSQQWQTQNCFNKIKALCSSSAHALTCHDQSLLNLMCDGRWLEISSVWNWQYSYRNCFLMESISPKLVHFAGAKKIWHHADGSIPYRYHEIYRDYLVSAPLKIAKIAPQIPPPDWNKQSLTDLKLKLMKNFFYAGPYQKYLTQFPDALAVVRHR